MVDPRFCETLQCFHHIWGDMTLPEGTKKQKSKPSEMSVNFGYDKNRPNTDFPIFYVQVWHHFGEHFSNNSGVGFRHSKIQKIKMALAFPPRLPRTHHRRGGNQRHPEAHGDSKRHRKQKLIHVSAKTQKLYENVDFTVCFQRSVSNSLTLISRTANTQCGCAARPIKDPLPTP